MKRMITVQHTQSVHHTNGMVGSWTDWDLTETGMAQAKRIGRRLAVELKDTPCVVYASDLKRAAQTAEQIAGSLGVPVRLRKELRERNLGRCVGKSVAWLREHIETPERTIDDRLFSDAESRRDEWLRLEPLFEEIMTGGDACVIVVSHGDLLGVFHAMFLGMAPEALNSVSLAGSAGSVSLLEVGDDGRRTVRRLNDTSYMQE